MALVVSSAARLKPEIRLAEAVSKYEASLSSEQKTVFRNIRSGALKSPPTSSDVMRCTAEIDRGLSSKARRRCFGPRFTNFMQGVQQFAALGDVVVGGSQNIIACSVWSLVRMSLLATINISSYMESLSMLFMEVGRSAPRYQMIGALYSRSKDLQAYLNEYFIAVVDLCQYIWNYSQKSALQKMTAGLSDSDIKAFRLDLASWAQSIKDEMDFLMAKRIEEEAHKNSKYRSFRLTNSKAIQHQQNLVAKMRTLDQCSTYDYETTWKQIRKKGTTTTFEQTEAYQTWRASDSTRTLHYKGILGSGKSVMMANIVEDLNIYIEGRKASLAYFFCRHDDAESVQSRTIIGAIARQILSDLPEVPGILVSSTKQRIIKQVSKLLPLGQKIFIVIDGLDSCSESVRVEVLREIERLKDQAPVLLCLNSRSRLGFRGDNQNLVTMPPNGSDIERYIEGELERCLENGQLVLGDPTLVLEIQDILAKQSRGMFLWVALQIKSLCMMQTDEQLRNAMAHLPEDLSDLYALIVDEQQGPAKTYQRRIFELVIAAQRPLTICELQEALSVTPGETDWDASKIINDVYATLAICGCLIHVDEEDLTVRLIHPSVEQYLYERYRDTKDAKLTIQECHQAMGETIVTYLGFGVFNTDISTSVIPKIEVGSTPVKIISATMKGSMQEVALKLLRLRKLPEFDIGKTVAEGFKTGANIKAMDYKFRRYASKYGLHHVGKFQIFRLCLQNLLPKVIQHLESSEILPAEPWVVAIYTGNISWAKQLTKSKTPLLSIYYRNWNPVKQSIKDFQLFAQRIAVLEYILESEIAKDFELLESFPHYLLRKVLFPIGADGNGSYTHEYFTLTTPLLTCAIRGGNTRWLTVLLREDYVDPNFGRPQETPIWEAVRRSDKSAVEILLSSGKLRMNDGEGDALMVESESRESYSIKEMLMEAKRDYILRQRLD